ncbi:hypothetical protein BV22DRAFT_474677 [Leucogyrophana mollusca]|uniref:Uncharacterized protein n=1 Tax=Leucogyrophana mollusca TaxID=85980 RepID=A0ACB8BGK2_9AGAM|nr:hypothetical protein BV22DRAFT_474677 [Leucogyrophana mollusca]
MCEPCRNRYRSYGITKRAKWKESRSAANAELDALREEEDKKRAEAGLPPLSESPEAFNEWEAKIIEQIDGPGPVFAEDGSVQGPVLPARMCTVSHCHRILSGHYKYRRCEQHRLQNRFHSGLKRVREKDMKAVGPQRDGEGGDETDAEGEPRKVQLLEPLFTSAPIDIVRGSREDEFDDEKTMESLRQMAGIPPAARGIRRDNHVCSVKTCFNLLAPHVPWKMCDPCREHDRWVRNNRRLRDRGELPPLSPRKLGEPRPPKQPKASRAKNAKKRATLPQPNVVEGDGVCLNDTPALENSNAEASGSATPERVPSLDRGHQEPVAINDPLIPPSASSGTINVRYLALTVSYRWLQKKPPRPRSHL